MNKTFLLIAILSGISFSASIPDSLLTPEQRAFVKAEELKTTMSTTQQATSSWIGVGKEIGEAVNGSMSAITENTNKFANTPVGKYTMFIVAFYVFKSSASAILLAFSSFFLWVVINTAFLIVKKSICKENMPSYDHDIIVNWQIGIFVVSTFLMGLFTLIGIGSI